jgi:BirA family biotin operon repressor/biotin-[acetyl-CoA-carboxylase] ligase
VPLADFDRELGDAASCLGPFAGRVRHVGSVASTNDVIANLADDGAPHGTVVVADAQTAGRGRHGRQWFSPPGSGLYFSILLRLNGPPPPVLTLATGVAVAEALQTATGVTASLEWPNDVMTPVDGASLKVAGILTEATTDPGCTRVIVGIGINIRDSAWPPDLVGVAASIEGVTGRSANATAVLVEVLAGAARRYAGVESGTTADLLARWESLAPSSRGARVEWMSGQTRQRGVSAGIDAQGALLVRVGSRLERLTGGAVRQVRSAPRVVRGGHAARG